MDIKVKINSTIKNQIFIFLVLSLSNLFASVNPSNSAELKPTSNEIKNVEEKKDMKKGEQQIANNSKDNYHKIMSTKGGCSASCCAGNGTIANVNSSKKKSDNQKAKKKFGWFSRSK